MKESTLRKLDLISAPLIVASIVSLALSAEIGNPSVAKYFIYFEFTLSILFTIEYAIRFYAGRWKYTFSFLGVIDLIATLPTLLIFAGATDLLVVRILRVFRFLSLLKLTRFNDAARRLYDAVKSVKQEFAMLALFTGVILVIASFGIRHFEHEAQPEHFGTFSDSLWWAIISLTTVGYGDVFPITVGGKVFASLLLLLCVGIIATPAGLIASALSNSKTIEQRQDQTDSLNSIKGSSEESYPDRIRGA